MLAELNRRLRDRAVVTAAILAIIGGATGVAAADSVGGNNSNGRRTASPIKHVIVIMGENRTFDHLFATYQPRNGQTVANLLSKGIINIDGSPGPNYSLAMQNYATVAGTFSISPGSKVPYPSGAGGTSINLLNIPSTSYAPKVPYTNLYDPVTGAAVNGPGAVATLALAHQATSDLRQQDYNLLTTGATGLPDKRDTRINNAANLPNGPYPLVRSTGESLYDTYGGSPVHRFYQMWQQLDCDAAKATPKNPSGCQADLFPFVEQTVSSGSNGATFSSYPAEGDIAMGFYNVAKGDVPYFTELANKYTLNDNYHQPVMGGTFANQMMFGYAGALYYQDPDGAPATPPANQIEDPTPQAGTNNFYTQDGYGGPLGGGSYSKCSDPSQKGVGPVVGYLAAIGVNPNCKPGAYYLLNNYVPAFIGNGNTDPANNGPFTLPPVLSQRHIGDALTANKVSWAYFGERWNDFKNAPGLGANFGTIDPPAYLYCNICNPFLYSASTMTNPAERTAHLKDTADLYDAIEDGRLPAVSWVKPSTFNDGHPASSKVDLLESFTHKIIDMVRANEELWESTAILVTVDEGGGYYDSGYVQPVDFFGDGTRIPLIVVSKYSEGARVSHEYSDHASIIKFIERNWGLPGKLSDRSRDNLPNPKTSLANPYVPTNRPAIGDLWGNFDFDRRDDDH
jgi:phospholipase C